MTDPITFDERGNLFPYQPISLPLPEIKKILVYSDKRSYLWNQFAGYVKALKDILKTEHFEVWIDGTFTTQTDNPQIITFCICIEPRWINLLNTKAKARISQLIDNGLPPSATCQGVEKRFHCRAQIILKDPPNAVHYPFTHPIYEKKKQDFLHDVNGNPKGFMVYNKQKGTDDT